MTADAPVIRVLAAVILDECGERARARLTTLLIARAVAELRD